MPTVCILYGFGEGPRIAERFRKALGKRGYTIIRNPAAADVLITHSGGHLLMPAKIHARQILHIAPYYWPGKSWASCMSRKIIDDIRIHGKEDATASWLRKSFWNLVYALRMPTNLRMLAAVIRAKPWRYGDRSIVARPRYDSFCVPDPNIMPFAEPPTFVSMSKQHDDCWRNPAPYLDLLK